MGSEMPVPQYKPVFVSEASFYHWRKKFGSPDINGMREMRQVADLTLDKHILGEALQKCLRPARRRMLVCWILKQLDISTCVHAGQSGSRDRRITAAAPLAGVRRTANTCACIAGVVPRAIRPVNRRSMDFVHDQVFDGPPMRVLIVLDQFTRVSSLVETRFALKGRDVAVALERVTALGRAPLSITVDHGPEFIAWALEDWAWCHQVKLDFTHPGKPAENGCIESFNCRLRDECLNVTQFLSFEDACTKIETCRIDYDEQRPRSSLGYLTPGEFTRRRLNTETALVGRVQ